MILYGMSSGIWDRVFLAYCLNELCVGLFFGTFLYKEGYWSLYCFFLPQLNALHAGLATQLADRMVFPMVQFREKDLTGKASLMLVTLYKMHRF